MREKTYDPPRERPNKIIAEIYMKDSFGKELGLEQEMEYLAHGYEWVTAEDYYKLCNDQGMTVKVVAVDKNSRGKKEWYLLKEVATGYWVPTATSGCRLRTGNPEHGR